MLQSAETLFDIGIHTCGYEDNYTKLRRSRCCATVAAECRTTLLLLAVDIANIIDSLRLHGCNPEMNAQGRHLMGRDGAWEKNNARKRTQQIFRIESGERQTGGNG